MHSRFATIGTHTHCVSQLPVLHLPVYPVISAPMQQLTTRCSTMALNTHNMRVKQAKHTRSTRDHFPVKMGSYRPTPNFALFVRMPSMDPTNAPTRSLRPALNPVRFAWTPQHDYTALRGLDSPPYMFQPGGNAKQPISGTLNQCPDGTTSAPLNVTGQPPSPVTSTHWFCSSRKPTSSAVATSLDHPSGPKTVKNDPSGTKSSRCTDGSTDIICTNMHECVPIRLPACRGSVPYQVVDRQKRARTQRAGSKRTMPISACVANCRLVGHP